MILCKVRLTGKCVELVNIGQGSENQHLLRWEKLRSIFMIHMPNVVNKVTVLLIKPDGGINVVHVITGGLNYYRKRN